MVGRNKFYILQEICEIPTPYDEYENFTISFMELTAAESAAGGAECTQTKLRDTYIFHESH